MRTNKYITTLDGHQLAVRCITTTADGGTLYSGSEHKTIRVWNTRTHQCFAILVGHQRSVLCLATTADGWTLYSGSEDHTINVWDTQKHQFSNSEDNTIRPWDIRKHQCLATLNGHQNSVSCLAVIDKEKKLFSSSFDNTVKVWNTQTHQCLITICEGGDGFHSFALFREKLFSSYLVASYAFINVRDTQTNDCIALYEYECIADFYGRANSTPYVAVAGGEVFFGTTNDSIIRVFNFAVPYSTMFERIAGLLERASLFERGILDTTREALELFSKMPEAKRNAIYGELYKIKTFANDYWGCGEHAFYDQYGQSSTFAEKAQAIRNYLKCRLYDNLP